MSRIVRPLISLVLLTLTVLGLMNVYADHTPVLEKAKDVACGGCDARLIELGKTPISHTYHLQIEGSRVEVVTCKRPAIFVGDYECAIAK